MDSITVLVSTAITPTGTPPSRALPVTTVRAQPACRQREQGEGHSVPVGAPPAARKCLWY